MADLDEFSVEQDRISRQQAIAQALMAKGASGGFINAYTSQNMMDQADKDRAALSQRYQSGLADEIKRIAAMRQGREAIPAPAEDLGGGPAAPAQPGDPRAAIQEAMMSRYAPVRRVGDLEYTHQKKADEPYTLKAGEIRITPGQPNTTNPNAPLEHESPLAKLIREKAKLPPGDPQHEAYDNAIRKASDIAGNIVNVQNPQPVTPVTIQDPDDPNGTIVIDGRTKERLGKGPKLTDAGKLENKRAFNMQGIGATIKEAEDLLTGASGQALPTGSGIGAAYDTVAGVFGASPEGAKEAQSLKAIGGALVSKMPRMEGPQSDKDVALYKEMAGVVGDATIPRARRVAALEKVKDLWAKYEKFNPEGFADRRANAESGGLPAASAIDAEIARRRKAKK
jgi:hypothetical protein